MTLADVLAAPSEKSGITDTDLIRSNSPFG